MHFWLHHTRAGSASAERVGQGEVGQGEVGQGEVGGVIRRVTCTWWLLGLAVKVLWLGLGGLIPALAACMDRLRKRHSHLVEGSFLAGKVAWTLSRCMTTDSADYCMLVNEWA